MRKTLSQAIYISFENQSYKQNSADVLFERPLVRAT